MPSLAPSVRIALAGLALAGAANTAGAAEKGKSSPAEFSAEVGVGVEYDSNVSVEEVDATSGEGDYALTMDLGLEA